MKKKNIRIIDTTTDDDRISQLPEFILHHILSFLYFPSDLVRMSVLSKKWFSLTASFPIFNFFIGYHKFSMSKQRFFKYVDYTTSRFSEQNVTSAHTLKLSAELREPTEIDIIDRCLGLIFKKSLQVLVIHLQHPYANHVPKYRVPDLLLLSESSLKSLTLCHCELPSSLIVDGVKFKSLKCLDLQKLQLDEEVIKGLTITCPLLEELHVQFCYGFKRFCVYGHQNLQQLTIFIESGLGRIDIEAPNLYLFLMDWERSGRPSLNMALCKKLTTLHFFGYPPPASKGLADFSSNFPFLETLYLNLPDECNNLNLSSHSLRTFVLHNSYCDLDKIDIKAPNLLSFDYNGHSHSRDDLVARNSTLSKTRMECYPEDDVDSLWFQKLRRFLGKKVSFKELKLWVMAEDPIDVEALKAIQWSRFELEHIDLELDFIKELSVYLSIVEAVLWCCHPQSLTLESYLPSINFEEWSHIVKFAYEKLLEQEDEGKTNIQIALASSSKPKRHFSNLNSLLTALPSDRLTQTITFIKEKG